jgi:predicted anti-sigma-YlaC factor YlaD
MAAHYWDMECDRAREAVSAQIDGEDGGLPDGALAAHLSGCADCHAWAQRAHVVTRRARLGGVFLDQDLTARVLAAAPPAPARRPRTVTQRTALAAVAALQLAITVPLLILGHDRDAGMHAAHELGSFDLALAIAFGVGAIRPALSAGLAWPCGIAAGDGQLRDRNGPRHGTGQPADDRPDRRGARGAVWNSARLQR